MYLDLVVQSYQSFLIQIFSEVIFYIHYFALYSGVFFSQTHTHWN